MKKGLKKLTALLCGATLAVSMVGCGTQDAGTTSQTTAEQNNNTTQQTAESQTTDTGKTEFNVWCWSPNEDFLQTGVDMYNDLGNYVSLNVTVMALEDVRTKIATIAGSGDYSQLPDILLMQDTSIPMLVKAYPDAFTDLNAQGINTADYDQAKIGWCTYDDKLYGVPFDSSVAVACYRTDYLQDAGYSIDDMSDITWSKFKTIGEEVLAKTGHPLLSMPSDATLLTIMLNSTGASYFDADGKANLNQNENLKKTVEEYRDLVNSGVIKVVTNWDEYMSSLNAGSSAGTINGMWILNSIKDAEDQSEKWGIANLPSVDGIQGAGNYASSGGSSWMITSNCKDVDGAVKMLTTILGGELSDTFYQSILLDSNYIAGYLPTAGNEEIYNTPDEFFNGETIYAELGQFATKIPKSNTGYAYDETLDAVATALTNILNGADIQSELDAAQSTVDFITGK